MAWKVKTDIPPAELPELPKAASVSVATSKPKERFQVVAQLPMRPVRQMVDEDGTIVNFVTIEEYLTNQANGGD